MFHHFQLLLYPFLLGKSMLFPQLLSVVQPLFCLYLSLSLSLSPSCFKFHLPNIYQGAGSMPGTILGTGSITVTEAGSMCQLSRSVHSSGETDTRPNTPDKRVTLAAGLGLLGGGGCRPVQAMDRHSASKGGLLLPPYALPGNSLSLNRDSGPF